MTENANQAPTLAVDSQVGQAWSQHFHGQNDAAAKMFEEILVKWPDHIDANFGLALTLKASGNKTRAAEIFRKTKALVEAAQKIQGDDISRNAMVMRMIDQHLATL